MGEMIKLTNMQRNVLSNPCHLTTFLYLLEGECTVDYLVRRTGYMPLEISVYLERMQEAELIENSGSAFVGGRTVQALYKVISPDLDISNVMSSLSESLAIDMIFSKVRSDLFRIQEQKLISQDSKISYQQLKVSNHGFAHIQTMLSSMEGALLEEDDVEGDEAVTVLVIAYRTKRD